MNQVLFLVLSAGTFILLLLANRFVRDFSPEQRVLRGKAYQYALLVMISLMIGFAVFDDLLSYRDTLVTIGVIGCAVFKNYCIWVGAYYPANEPPRLLWSEVLGDSLLLLLWFASPLASIIKWSQILFWGSLLFSHVGKYYWDKWKVKYQKP